jgi:hypothetical protein
MLMTDIADIEIDVDAHLCVGVSKLDIPPPLVHVHDVVADSVQEILQKDSS